MAFADRMTRPTVGTPVLGAIGLVVALVIIVAGNYNVPEGENGGTGPAIGTAVICLVLAAALFGFVVPRAGNLDRTALILGILAIVSVVVFWSGVTPVLTAAALAVTKRRESAPPTGVVVVEGLALLATLAALGVSLAGSHFF